VQLTPSGRLLTEDFGKVGEDLRGMSHRRLQIHRAEMLGEFAAGGLFDEKLL